MENTSTTCTTQGCINRVHKLQYGLEKQNDFYRNNPCHYAISGSCSSTKIASFIIADDKAIGVQVEFFEKKSWSFIGSASAAELPDKGVGSNSYGKIVQYYASGDHAPPHVHVVDNKGNVVRVGQNGKPLKGDPELNTAQQRLVNDFKPQIRSTITRIMKWYRANNTPRTPRG